MVWLAWLVWLAGLAGWLAWLAGLAGWSGWLVWLAGLAGWPGWLACLTGWLVGLADVVIFVSLWLVGLAGWLLHLELQRLWFQWFQWLCLLRLAVFRNLCGERCTDCDPANLADALGLTPIYSRPDDFEPAPAPPKNQEQQLTSTTAKIRALPGPDSWGGRGFERGE